MFKVLLTDDEITKAKTIAPKWKVTQGSKVYKVKWGQDTSKTMEDTVLGVCYEMVVAKALHIDYDGDIGVVGNYDVGGKYEVRGTKYRNGCLLLHPEDKEAPYILVTGEGKDFNIVGWIMGSEGKKDKYWRTDVRYPCYFVPQDALKDLSLLT